MKEVTAVIPAGNCRGQVRKCLRELAAGDFVPEIIVVDDGSDDGTAQMVKKDWPEAVLLSLPAHTGYAHAANAGLRLVRTEFAFLIRPDLQPGRGCIKRLLEAMRAENDLGGKEKTEKTGRQTFCAAPRFVRGPGRAGAPGRTREILALDDGCAMYRMKVLEEIGWLDERHFEGLEAFDLSLRAALYGYRTLRVCGAAVRPRPAGAEKQLAAAGTEKEPAGAKKPVSDGRGNTDTFHRQLAAGNAAYIFYKNIPPFQRLLGLPAYAAADLVRLGAFLSRGEYEEYRMAVTRGRALCSLEEERREALEDGIGVYPETLSDASFLGMNEKAGKIYPLYLAEKEFFGADRLLRYLHIQRLLMRDLGDLLRLLR